MSKKQSKSKKHNTSQPDYFDLYNDRHDTKIAMAMMVKNESFRIEVSLKSCLGFISKFIIYDTGSTDTTVDIIKNFCKKYKISLYLKYGTFIDFSTSRNILLQFADTINNIDYILLLDCNDELQNGANLIKFCKQEHKESAFFIKQSWKTDIIIDYFNIRLIKPRHGWKYNGVVHEYIDSDSTTDIKIPDVVLFQDRTKDDNKSGLRFIKDKELLLSEYKKEDKTPRTIYYLAQTCECLRQYDEAIIYFKDRLNYEGFYEERYQAAYHIGMISRRIGKSFEDYSGYFLLAFSIMHRTEPLVRLAEYYIDKKAWTQAYFYLHESCKIDIPICGLFVDSEMYKYYRWHLMGIVAFYTNQYKEGFDACKIAISIRNNIIDRNNLDHYISVLPDLSVGDKLMCI
jgi:tetratricopeptide (TPR) repeat protein